MSQSDPLLDEELRIAMVTLSGKADVIEIEQGKATRADHQMLFSQPMLENEQSQHIEQRQSQNQHAIHVRAKPEKDG